MANNPADLLAKHLHALSTAAREDRVSDGELLQRFVAQRDEDAFAALVRRYGSMVLHVCRRVLQNVHDAEDVCQATFLVLSQKAASLRRVESVGCFLHSVAYRLSLKQQARFKRQRIHESRIAVEQCVEDPLAELNVREAMAILDEELTRLPEQLRAPLLLCTFQGLTRDEAARQLGWSAKLVKSRLERGRARLRCRLSRHGLTLPAAMFGTLVTQKTAPAWLVRAVVQAALVRSAGGATTRAALLASGMIGSASTAKLKTAIGLLVLLGVLAAGAGVFIQPQSKLEPSSARALEKPRAEEVQPPRIDRFGDPLPPGAIARLGTSRWRHGDQVMSVAFSPDGKTLASGAMDKLVHLWDVNTGRRLRTFRGHEKEVSCVLFTPDGSRLITHGWDTTTRLWNVDSGKELHRWTTPGGWNVALSPDGKTLAGFGSAQPQHTLYLWDVATGTKIREMRYEGNEDGLMTLAFAPDGKTLVTGGDRVLRCWDVATGKQHDVFGAGRGQTHAIVFSPDGKKFAVASHDAAALWDAVTRKEILKLPERFVYSVAISPDGKLLATGSQIVRIWDAATGKELRTCKSRHQGRVWSVAFSPDSKTVAGGREGSSLQLWNAATGEERTTPAGHESGLLFTRLTSDGKAALTGSWDGWVRRWDIATAKETLSFLANDQNFCIAYALAPDGHTLIVENNNLIQLRDALTGEMLRRFGEHEKLLRDLVISPYGDRIAFVPFGGSAVELWDMKNGKKLRDFRIPRDCLSVNCLAFSPDGKILATGGGLDDLVVHLWEVDTGKPIRRLTTQQQQSEPNVRGVTAVAFSPDSKLLAAAGADRTIRIWDLTSGGEFVRLHPDQPFLSRCLVFAPDGKTLATAGSDQTVRLWETASGKERRCFRGHAGQVFSVAYSADGSLLVSGGSDTSALVWTVWPMAPATEATLLSADERDRVWNDLADAARSWPAMEMLHNHPRSALSLLEKQLASAIRPDDKMIAQRIAELDSERFEVRSKAETELEKLDELAEPILRQALQDKSASLELRRRIEGLLKRLEGPISSPQTLRRLRAIEILEHLNSPEARRLLRTLAGGAAEARLTREARAALDRLSHNASAVP